MERRGEDDLDLPNIDRPTGLSQSGQYRVVPCGCAAIGAQEQDYPGIKGLARLHACGEGKGGRERRGRGGGSENAKER